MNQVSLTINGTRWQGWTTIEIRHGLDQLAASFSLTSSQPKGTSNPQIIPGSHCQIEIDNTPVIDGYIDDVAPRLEAKRHQVTVRGRDRCGDLVDCAAIHQGGQFTEQTLTQIATTLCKPFGITVVANTDVGKPFKNFRLQPGATVFETLQRAANHRGVLLTSNGLGQLIITRVNGPRLTTALVEGQNVKSASGHASWRRRHSSITVLGQSAGDNMLNGPQASELKAQVDDPEITRHRPTVIIADEAVDLAAVKELANWERSVRRGRSKAMQVVTLGWYRHITEPLWTHGRTVETRIPTIGQNADMLIESVTLTQGKGGTLAELGLVHPDAYNQIATPEPAPVGVWGAA